MAITQLTTSNTVLEQMNKINEVITTTGDISYDVTTGSSSAYILTLDPIPTSYTAGMIVYIKANHASTGASTIDINSLGAKTILKNGGADALQVGDIIIDQISAIVYDGTVFQLISLPAKLNTNSIADNALTLDKQAHGTANNILKYDGTGVPVEGLLTTDNVTDNIITLDKQAHGTANNILKYDGTGVPVEGTIDTSNVTDNAITLDKQAHGTAGNIPVFDATGAPSVAVTGSAGQVLTSGGAGVAPTMQDVDKSIAVNEQTLTTYTLVASDEYVRLNNAGAITLTIPPSVFVVGDQILFRGVGAGVVTITPGAGVNINTPETLILRTQHSTATLICVASNTFDLAGDLVAT